MGILSKVNIRQGLRISRMLDYCPSFRGVVLPPFFVNMPTLRLAVGWLSIFILLIVITHASPIRITSADNGTSPLVKRLPPFINCNDHQEAFVASRLRDVERYAKDTYEWLKDDSHFHADAKEFVLF